ncbi:MAG: prepilin-type N-terminal cleavage/methylation domain-containing protein [Azoarcus sp.]|jgi:general secretion pathway protein I|nr:prepilin-type N-terminal cleavage/methylation domain-containing protein [Azoarcus sp.]
MRRTTRRDGGFSLLEVVVAMSIMALSLGALYQASGGALRGVVDTEARIRATALATSLLDGQASVPPNGLREEGVSGDMRWRLATSPFQPKGTGEWALHRVEVEVSWDDGRRVLHLASLLPERRSPLNSPVRR